MNNPDYVPSVFVYANTTSNNDKRSRYERLKERLNKQQTQAKVTTQNRSEQVDIEMLDRVRVEWIDDQSRFCTAKILMV